MKYLLLITTIIVLISCNSSDEELTKFKDIYFEILVIREKHQDTSEANPMVRKLLQDNGFNEHSFRDYSMDIYNEDPHRFTVIIDSIRAKAEKKLTDFGKERMKTLDSTNKANSSK